MKKLILLFLLALALFQVRAQSIKFSSASPEIGKPLKFEYYSRGGSLAGYENVRCVVKTFSDRDHRISTEVKLVKVGELYQGEFMPSDSTHLAMFIFFADEIRDENPIGYFTKFFKNGTATPRSLFLEGYLYAGLGNKLVKLKTDNEKAFNNYQLAFKADPNLKEQYLNDLLVSQNIIDRGKAEQLAKTYIGIYAKAGTSESSLTKTAALYDFLKDKARLDSVNKLLRTKYPKGAYALKFTIDSIMLGKDPYKTEEALQKVVTDFGLDLNKESDVAKMGNAYIRLGFAFVSVKDGPKVEKYIDMVALKPTRATFYNSFAAISIRTKDNLDFAIRNSEKAIGLLEMAMKEEMTAYDKEYYNTKESYYKMLENLSIAYKDTYANLLALKGDNAVALVVLEEVVKGSHFESTAMNERYVDLLIKSGKSDQVASYVGQFVKAGTSSNKLKENLRSVYKGAIPFDSYYASLEKEGADDQLTQLKAEIINVPAPAFTLTNLKGEKISLASLKGKTVIVDFWATWCGPCVASFPGMQKAVDKYKNDPSVVFLFVNTWQWEDDREKVVKDWIAANKYTFSIFLDAKHKENQNEFVVVDAYKVRGIPTKFVIDGKGNIRFKKVGAPETVDGIVKEIDQMLKFVKESP